MNDNDYNRGQLGDWEAFLLRNDLLGLSSQDTAGLAVRSALRIVQFAQYRRSTDQLNIGEIGEQSNTHPKLVFARLFLNLLVANRTSEPRSLTILAKYKSCFQTLRTVASTEKERHLFRCITKAIEAVFLQQEGDDSSFASVESAAACLELWDSYPPRLPNSTQYEADIHFLAGKQELARRPLFGGKQTTSLMGFWGNDTAFGGTHLDLEFFELWHRGFIDGKPLDWELQRLVALIPDAQWELGPKQIAGEIKKIQKRHEVEKVTSAARTEIEEPVPLFAPEAIIQKLTANREAIALAAAGLLEQLSEFREKVRGDNKLDVEIKAPLLAFLDNLTVKLHDLLRLIPMEGVEIEEQDVEGGIRWLRSFRVAFLRDARKFSSPENIAGATIPTAIILGCSGLGAMVGMPIAGTVVGGLLTGQLKPGKAADEVLKPRRLETDP